MWRTLDEEEDSPPTGPRKCTWHRIEWVSEWKNEVKVGIKQKNNFLKSTQPRQRRRRWRHYGMASAGIFRVKNFKHFVRQTWIDISQKKKQSEEQQLTTLHSATLQERKHKHLHSLHHPKKNKKKNKWNAFLRIFF